MSLPVNHNGLTFSLNLRGANVDSQFFEDLPNSVKEAVDKIARVILDPENGHALVLGFNSSGKSFLIEQFAGNIDRYLVNSNLDNLHILEISRADAILIENMPNGVTHYIDAVSKSLETSPENICLVTESPDFAAAIYAHSKNVKVILELNVATFISLEARENKGVSKIWSSWGKIDANEVFLTREELVDVLSLVMLPKIEETYGVTFTDSDIDHMIEHFLGEVPAMLFTPEPESDEEARELEELDAYGKIIVPPGFWGLALRKLASSITHSSSEKLLNKSGQKDFCLHVEYVIKELTDDLTKMFNMLSAETSVFPFDLPFDLPEGTNLSVIHMGGGLRMAGMEEDEDEYDLEPVIFSDLDTLTKRLKKTVIGQDSAIESVVDSMAVPAAGIHAENKPIRSFLFLGPTGVGKTQLALSMADQIATEKFNVIRLDMSEYSQPHEASKLLGSPAGYVGHEEGGVLTNAVYNNPRSLILLDEVEKAHHKIWDSFLQILDAGRMTDNRGREIDFTRCIIVMTSNLGAKGTSSMSGLGFHDALGVSERAQKATLAEVEKFFRPEFINRIDELVYFNQLSIETAREIVRREITLVSNRMTPSGFKLSKFEDDLVDEIIKLSSFSKYGARDIQRAVFKNISQPLAKRMLSKTKKRKMIKLSLNNENKIQVN